MALVESAGAAYVTSGTNTVTSAAFTPTAGALLVAIVTAGDGNGVEMTSVSLTDNSGSGSWTQLVLETPPNTVGGNCYGGVFVRDAFSGSHTVTWTVNPNTVLDVTLIVRQFTGAKAAASQNGVTAVTFSSVNALSITPGQTGSQVVGGFATSAGAQTKTANGNTTIYNQFSGAAGDQSVSLKATSLSTGGTPVSLGFTNTAVNSVFALAEILAAPVNSSNFFAFFGGAN